MGLSQEYRDNMATGLNHWIKNGEAGNIKWGYLVCKKF